MLLKYSFLGILCCSLFSCEKNDPLSELGETNGQYAAALTVSYNTTKPLVGDTVVVTASTWQKDDKIAKLMMTETIVEDFGIDLKLENGTVIKTFDSEAKESFLKIADTTVNDRVWFEIDNSNNQLNNYFVTLTNNYVVRARYPFEIKEGKYSNDLNLISQISESDFAVVKSLLAYRITAADYIAIFPDAPSNHFTNGGTYVLTSLGMGYLRENLSKELIIPYLLEVKKVGTYQVGITTSVSTPTGALSSSSTTFEVSL